MLFLSLALRVSLVMSGGQNYWPDERRYDVSRRAADALWNGDVLGTLRALNSASHFLYKVIGVVPALVQKAVSPSPKIPALFFSWFSIANLWLAWAVVRRTGENKRVALLAAVMLALCSTFLYYCRHLLPYDAAMAFGLLSLFLGLRSPPRAVDSVLCGFFSLCAFLTYNGYWVLAGLALSVHILRPPRTYAAVLRRAAISGAAFVFPLAVLLTVSAMASDWHLLRQFIVFSRTVTQGSFSEGWSLPFAYLWDAEHTLALLWVAAFLWGIRECALGRRRGAIALGVLGFLSIYAALVFSSVVLEKFVVYGRTARMLVPFSCILAAPVIDRVWTSAPRGKLLAVAMLAIAVVQAAMNFCRPLTQTFPAEFLQLAAKASVPTDTGEYAVLFARHLYQFPLPSEDSGTTILQRYHPLEFLPYQYEGYTPDQRGKLRSTDIRMRLILRRKP
jgi:hypothetical protein